MKKNMNLKHKAQSTQKEQTLIKKPIEEGEKTIENAPAPGEEQAP